MKDHTVFHSQILKRTCNQNMNTMVRYEKAVWWYLGVDLHGEEETEAGMWWETVQFLLQLDQPLRSKMYILQHHPSTNWNKMLSVILGAVLIFIFFLLVLGHDSNFVEWSFLIYIKYQLWHTRPPFFMGTCSLIYIKILMYNNNYLIAISQFLSTKKKKFTLNATLLLEIKRLWIMSLLRGHKEMENVNGTWLVESQ